VEEEGGRERSSLSERNDVRANLKATRSQSVPLNEDLVEVRKVRSE